MLACREHTSMSLSFVALFYSFCTIRAITQKTVGCPLVFKEHGVWTRMVPGLHLFSDTSPLTNRRGPNVIPLVIRIEILGAKRTVWTSWWMMRKTMPLCMNDPSPQPGKPVDPTKSSLLSLMSKWQQNINKGNHSYQKEKVKNSYL